ncbi:MAG: chemotaxis protein CheW [Alphaproteobacteria bacterium]
MSSAAHEQTEMLVSFRIGAQLYGLPVAQVKDALRDIEVAPVPLAAEGIVGIATHREKIVPVLDLRRCFGMAKPPEGASQAVLVVAHADEEIALVVDKVEELITARPQDFIRAPATVDESWKRVATEIVRHEGGLLALLNLDGVLGALQ